ncbi:MAG: hypothetical protein ACU0CO_05525 [Shimia sp.]
MTFDALESVALNGRPGLASDDRCGVRGGLAWVIDGATDIGPPGLMGAQGGAAWLAAEADAAFAAATAPDLPAICAEVFAALGAAFDGHRTRPVAAAWEVPKAAFAAIRLTQGRLEAAWAADCPVLHVSGDGVRWATGTPDTSGEAMAAAALGAGAGPIEGAILDDRRAHRARPDHAALSPDAAASTAATRHDAVPVAPGDEVLLMSDGFASLVTDYGAHTPESLVQALHAGGLLPLFQELREIERGDAECRRFPRFKPSDDATALWLRVAG